MARTEILYRLTVGRPLVINQNLFTPFKNEGLAAINLEDFYNTSDPEAYQLDKHQVVFSIKMTSLTQKVNTGKFTIMNLDDDFVNYLISNRDNNLSFVFEAGDNDQGIQEIFKGTVTNVKDNFSKETRVTDLTVVDGGLNSKNAYTVKSFARNTPYSTVIQSLVDDLKLPVESFPPISGATLTPVSYSGPTVKLLAEELNRQGYTFSIQNQAVSILDKNKRKPIQASLITPDTGLIGRVQRYTDNDKSSANKESQMAEGVSFTCLLDSALKPDETVYLEDEGIDGPYKLVEVNFDGDYEGGVWICECRAVVAEGVTSA